MRIENQRDFRKGGALLAVLWLTAALSVIAFALATTVRGEVERTGVGSDGVRAYYLAAGAIERAILYMEWGPAHTTPDGSSRYYAPWMTKLRMPFPLGEAMVEIIPEASKININTARPEDLFALLIALGAEPERARQIALAIVDWRTPARPDTVTLFDQYYLGLNPSFRARHASFEEIEEALLIRGMTPDLFFGSYARGRDGKLIPRPGFRDCATAYRTVGSIDVNTAQPPVLAALGLSPEAVAFIVQRRMQAPFRNMRELEAFRGERGFNRLGLSRGTILTLRATARLRLPNGELSDLRRSVAATIKRSPPTDNRSYHILRWRENAWSADPAAF